MSRRVKKSMDLIDESLRTKNIKIYDQWNDTVYGTLQRGIEQALKKVVSICMYAKHMTMENDIDKLYAYIYIYFF